MFAKLLAATRIDADAGTGQNNQAGGFGHQRTKDLYQL